MRDSTTVPPDDERATALAAAAAAVTPVLARAEAGDPRAAADLLPLVYDQLRALAAAKLRRERVGDGRPEQTLQATALVHEAYLRVVAGGGGGGAAAAAADWDGRWHFFGAAAEAMRRILVEAARSRGRAKRGGGRRRVSMDGVDPGAELTVDNPPDELLAVDEALGRLETVHPQKAQLVKLRYFAGLTIEQAAAAMGVSVPTANRHWAFARAWLYHHISAAAAAGTPGAG
jgi:RNA polymerase sigma factor (TIGR02999 family)